MPSGLTLARNRNSQKIWNHGIEGLCESQEQFRPPVNYVSNRYPSWGLPGPSAFSNPNKPNPKFIEEEIKNQGARLRPPCWWGSKWSLEPRLSDFWFCPFLLLEFYALHCFQTTWDVLEKIWNFNVAKLAIMGFLQIHKFYKYHKWRFGLISVGKIFPVCL